jgi:DNA-binding response OmpR family regulator
MPDDEGRTHKLISEGELANCDIFLVDNDLNSRSSVRNILHNHGFRKLHQARSARELRQVLQKHMPDLLIGSYDLPDDDFIDCVLDIRQGMLGVNPFIPIITLVEEPTPEVVTRVVESGTDTVIAKPISTAQMLDRVNDLIESRKKFIMSEGYIGPARRKDSGTPGIEAPNTLRAKAKGENLNVMQIENMIANALAKMKTLKVDVIGVHVAAHVTALVPMLERSGRVDPSIRNELLALLDITDSASETLVGSSYEYTMLLCDSLGNVASAILASRGGIPDPKEIKLLKPLSQAIQACFSGAITSAEQVNAIAVQIGAR